MTPIEYAASLRELAGWYEAHPEAPVPYDPVIYVSAEDTIEAVGRLARELAPCEKALGGAESDTFSLVRRFGALTLQFVFWRSAVCTKRVVGTETVPERVIPAHTKELVEWDCPDSVLSHDPL